TLFRSTPSTYAPALPCPTPSHSFSGTIPGSSPHCDGPLPLPWAAPSIRTYKSHTPHSPHWPHSPLPPPTPLLSPPTPHPPTPVPAPPPPPSPPSTPA